MKIIQWLLGTTEYISELDQFLKHLTRMNPQPSPAQRAEIVKHQRVFLLRDHAMDDQPSKLWDDF